LLIEHDYPGNVRELHNVIEHAFVLCHSGPICPEHLPPYLRDKTAGLILSSEGRTDIRTIEKMLIVETLQKHGGNRTLAAKDLGINTSTLYRKIRKLNVEIPKQDGRSRRPKEDG